MMMTNALHNDSLCLDIYIGYCSWLGHLLVQNKQGKKGTITISRLHYR